MTLIDLPETAPLDTEAAETAAPPVAVPGANPTLVLSALAVGGFAIGTTEFAAMSLLPAFASGRFSKRRVGPGLSGYAAAQPIISYQYDPTDNFSIEPGLWFDARDSRNVAGVPDKSFGTFNGGSLELKYQFFKRTDQRPFSVALQVEPEYARITPVEGQGADVFSVETRLIADARLVPDRLWAGVNLIYDPQVSRLKGTGEVDRTSTLYLGHADGEGRGQPFPSGRRPGTCVPTTARS